MLTLSTQYENFLWNLKESGLESKLEKIKWIVSVLFNLSSRSDQNVVNHFTRIMKTPLHVFLEPLPAVDKDFMKALDSVAFRTNKEAMAAIILTCLGGNVCFYHEDISEKDRKSILDKDTFSISLPSDRDLFFVVHDMVYRIILKKDEKIFRYSKDLVSLKWQVNASATTTIQEEISKAPRNKMPVVIVWNDKVKILFLDQ